MVVERASQPGQRDWTKGRAQLRPSCSRTRPPFSAQCTQPASRARSHYRGRCYHAANFKNKRIRTGRLYEIPQLDRQKLHCRPKGAKQKKMRRPAVRALDRSMPHVRTVTRSDSFTSHYNLEAWPYARGIGLHRPCKHHNPRD